MTLLSPVLSLTSTSTEEEEEKEEEDEEDEGPDALVEHLFDVIKDLKIRAFELELRCAAIETETREEMTRVMEAREREWQRELTERIMDSVRFLPLSPVCS